MKSCLHYCWIEITVIKHEDNDTRRRLWQKQVLVAALRNRCCKTLLISNRNVYLWIPLKQLSRPAVQFFLTCFDLMNFYTLLPMSNLFRCYLSVPMDLCSLAAKYTCSLHWWIFSLKFKVLPQIFRVVFGHYLNILYLSKNFSKEYPYLIYIPCKCQVCVSKLSPGIVTRQVL
jgi:hypothetical protein